MQAGQATAPYSRAREAEGPGLRSTAVECNDANCYAHAHLSNNEASHNV